MSGVNVPLLRKAVEWAEAEAAKPTGSLWIQQMWVTPPGVSDSYSQGLRKRNGLDSECGTAYCIAGYVCHAEGLLNPDGRTSGVGSKAAEALGIEWSDEDDSSPGQRLFRATNRIEDVRRIAEEIAGERL